MAVSKIFWAFLLLCAASRVSLAESLAEELADIRAKSKNGVIRLTEDLFDQFVASPTARDYGVLIFFDAKMLHDNNDLKIVELKQEFSLASKAFLQTHAADGDEDSLKLFFCEAEVESNRRVFQRFGIQALPHMRYIQPGKTIKTDEFDFQTGPRTADGYAGFIKSVAGIDIGPIPRPPPVTGLQITLIVVVLAVTAPWVLRLIMTGKTPLHDPRVWCILGLTVYVFSVSGGMYNIIRGMPMYIPDREKPGRFIYFYNQSGAQFGAEGFTLGTLYTIVGLLLAFATYVVPRVSNAWIQRGLMLAVCGLSYAAVKQVVTLDHNKQGYWAHFFWPKWM